MDLLIELAVADLLDQVGVTRLVHGEGLAAMRTVQFLHDSQPFDFVAPSYSDTLSSHDG